MITPIGQCTRIDILWSVAPRKNRSEGPIFFMGLSQRTRTDFLSLTKHQTYLTIFLSECHLAHTVLILYRSYCVVAMAGKAPLLDYVTPIFYWTEVSAHGVIFYRRQIVGMERSDFFLTKSQHTWTNFHSDFFVCDKKSVCVRLALSNIFK